MRVAVTGAPNGTPALNTVPAARQATIQDLMRHTAGYTYGNRGASEWHKRYPSSSDAVAENLSGPEFLVEIGKLPLHFHPGTAWDYSFGFDILGLAMRPARCASSTANCYTHWCSRQSSASDRRACPVIANLSVRLRRGRRNSACLPNPLLAPPFPGLP